MFAAWEIWCYAIAYTGMLVITLHYTLKAR